MKQVKKKNLVPLIVFLLSMCLVGFIVYKTDTHEKWQRRTTAQLNVSTYGERIKNEITNGIAITDTLKQVLISGNGDSNLIRLQKILYLILLKVYSLLRTVL